MVVIGKKMIFDRYTIAFGVLIGIFNGILFSYYSEAPTIFIERFHFNQSQYGFMGCAVATATILGAWLSNWRLKQNSPHKIIKEGILLALIGTLFLSMVALFPLTIQVIFYIFFISIILVGIGMSLPNCLSLALVKFQEVAGTAGAFFKLRILCNCQSLYFLHWRFAFRINTCISRILPSITSNCLALYKNSC